MAPCADRRSLEERFDPLTHGLVLVIHGEGETRATPGSGVGAVGRR
jgi:hypothetical protein